MALAASSLEAVSATPLTSRWRRIRTEIPAQGSINEIERLRRVEPRSMSGMPPILWNEAEGFLVRDRFGNQWIDLTSGIVLANAGHAHPRIVHAIQQAAERRMLATYAFPSADRLHLLEKLISISPIPDAKAMLYSSGTEAAECALALMRLHGQKIDHRKVGIISLAGNYHGRTLAAQLASGALESPFWIRRDNVFHYQIPSPETDRCLGGHVPGQACGAECFYAAVNELAARGIAPDSIAGLILEPVPGWTTLPLPREFVAAAASWAKENQCLLTFDEIQCGCGRTGKFFGCEHLGITPDLIVLGKGLSSSLPVSAVLGTASLMDLPAPGEMSSTHGGNPVCAAAALANLQVIEDEQLVDASASTGAIILELLRALVFEFPQYVRAVQGVGLFISIHLTQPGTDLPHVQLADEIAEMAVQRGVLMFKTGRGYLKFTPPLCIDPSAAVEAADVIRECLIERVQR